MAVIQVNKEATEATGPGNGAGEIYPTTKRRRSGAAMSASAVRVNTKTTKGVMDRRCKSAHGSVLGRAVTNKAEVVHVQNSAYFELARLPRLPVGLGGDANALRWTNV